MADNYTIVAGSSGVTTSGTYGSDDCTVNGVPTVKVPLGKIGFGINDQWTYVSASNGLPCAQQGTWTVGLNGSIPAGGNVIGHVITDTGSVVAAAQSGSWNVGVSGTVAVSALPSGLAVSALQPALNGDGGALAHVTNFPATVNSQKAGDFIEIGGATYQVLNAFANATTSGNTTVVAGTTGKKIKVLSYSIGPVSAAVNVFFGGSTTGALCSTKDLAANSGVGRAFSEFGHFATAVNAENLQVNLSGNANVGVDVQYILFP